MKAEQARREAEERAWIEATTETRQAQQPAKAAVSTAQQEAEKDGQAQKQKN